MDAHKRILITGASGFVGRPLVHALLRAGYDVRAAARRPIDIRGVETRIIPDLKDPIEWAPLLDGIGTVIHVAGLAHGFVANEEYSEFDQVNWLATQQLAHAAKAANVERLIYVSSVRAQVGAAADHVVCESDEPQPTNYYGRSKLAAETAIAAAGVPFTIFRPVVIYGPGAKGNMQTLLRLAKSSLPVPVGCFRNRRSLLGIDNFVSAILFALDTPATVGEIYLIADPKPMAVADIIATLRAGQGRSLKTFPLPAGFVRWLLVLIGRQDLWARFAGDLVVDVGKFEALGWRPANDTAQGLAAMLQPANKIA
jgi:UDP-glucose 4-epimerase